MTNFVPRIYESAKTNNNTVLIPRIIFRDLMQNAANIIGALYRKYISVSAC